MRPYHWDYGLDSMLHGGLSALLLRWSGYFQEYVVVILALIFLACEHWLIL